MNLLNIQRQMARCVMTPLTPSEHMSEFASDGRSLRGIANRIIKPNDRLTSFERMEVYNRQYWFRVLSGLAEDFPGLRAILGSRVFDRTAKAYLKDCPSRSFTMRNVGSQLESWLAQHPEYARRRTLLALDMVRLEWAEINAFDGPREESLKREDLVKDDPAKLRLRLQPYLSLLRLSYPVDDLLLAVRRNSGEANVASNAFRKPRKSKRAVAAVHLNPNPLFLAVHRMDEEVYFRHLEPEEFAILSLLREGKALSAAIESALRKSATIFEERPLLMQKWFQAWSRLGWLCSWSKHSASL